MKRHFSLLNKRSLFTLILAILLFGGANLFAQDENSSEPEKDTRPVKNTFESIWLIDNQTVMVPIKKTLEIDFQHRFGLLKDGYTDFYGLFSNSNIRLGFNYVPIEKIQIGFGITKERLLWDFNIKYAFLKQGRSGGSPVSVTYFGNMAIDTRNKENFNEFIDRISYFNQLMVARKITKAFSLQVAGNLSWVNAPKRYYDDEQVYIGRLKNGFISMSVLGRYKFTDAIALIVNYDQPLTKPDIEAIEPLANLSFGIEIATSSHAFQVFAGNYQSIVPQINNTENRNSISKGEFAIGFNITRLWNY